jgi:hypothetical protein
MIFLIKYDRKSGKLVDLREFSDSQAEDASEARLAAEMREGPSNATIEIVTLQAASVDDLRLTHSRYFRNVRELGELLRPR